ncbi:hypothetical protein NLN92_23450 [Citrobacter portucalensis]|uniref:hypothetical protein n=1 Tax=Citrobacter portucalensis TaxID=1639133 RepID=UPI00226B1A58|nr:hypothetical protein [Citrobacter portucalensis]MCX8980954.1 hypothetical protein [Citrobacter portucalensis]
MELDTDYNDEMMLFTLYAFRRHGAIASIPFDKLNHVLSLEMSEFYLLADQSECLSRLRQRGLLLFVFKRFMTCHIELTPDGLEAASNIYHSRLQAINDDGDSNSCYA